MFPTDPTMLNERRFRHPHRSLRVGDLARDDAHPDPLGAALTRVLLKIEDTANVWRERWTLASTAREQRHAEQIARTRFEV